MAKAYYFKYKSVSDTSQYTTDEVVHICGKMAQIVIATFKEYGLHVKDNDFISYKQGEKLLSDERSICCVCPDKCGVAWDPSTWDYSKDKLGEIYVAFKKDNKIVVSFGTNRIAKKSTNKEIISRIRDKAVVVGILAEKSVIYETDERTVEEPKGNTKTDEQTFEKSKNNIKFILDNVENNGGQIIEKTDEKTVYKKICHKCNGNGKINEEITMQSFSKDRTNGNVERICSTCEGTGFVTFVDLVGKYRTGKEVSLEALGEYFKEECKMQDKIFALIEKIELKYDSVIGKDSYWILCQKTARYNDHRTGEDKDTTFSFILDSAGNLSCRASYEIMKITNEGAQWWHGSEGTVEFHDFDEYMCEFDFSAIGHNHNSSFHESTKLVKYIGAYANGEFCSLIRKYEKGYGLYYALKSILEEEKQPHNSITPASVIRKERIDFLVCGICWILFLLSVGFTLSTFFNINNGTIKILQIDGSNILLTNVVAIGGVALLSFGRAYIQGSITGDSFGIWVAAIWGYIYSCITVAIHSSLVYGNNRDDGWKNFGILLVLFISAIIVGWILGCLFSGGFKQSGKTITKQKISYRRSEIITIVMMMGLNGIYLFLLLDLKLFYTVIDSYNLVAIALWIVAPIILLIVGTNNKTISTAWYCSAMTCVFASIELWLGKSNLWAIGLIVMGIAGILFLTVVLEVYLKINNIVLLNLTRVFVVVIFFAGISVISISKIADSGITAVANERCWGILMPAIALTYVAVMYTFLGIAESKGWKI